MEKHTQATFIADMKTNNIFIYTSPNFCPSCGVGIDPKVLGSYYAFGSDKHGNYNGKLFILFFCPKCETCFIGYFRLDSVLRGYENRAFFEKLAPFGFRKEQFSDNIKLLSPDFESIYNQSLAAEQMGLNEICGMGYRKSLEFLVKDFAIYIDPTNKDNIESKMLGKCIQDHIEHSRIKTLAVASSWIGNDETHYIRKNDDYGVDHLKAFISAIVTYIDSELSFIDAEKMIAK